MFKVFGRHGIDAANNNCVVSRLKWKRVEMRSKLIKTFMISITTKFEYLVTLPTSCKKNGVLLGVGVSLLWSGTTQAAEIRADISLIGDAVNLEFEGRSDWPYDLVRKNNQVEITIPKVDSLTRSRLLSWKGPLISKVEIKPGVDEKDTLVFTLTKSNIQSFDYLTDQPSRLIVDFFTADETPKTADTKSKKVESANKIKNSDLAISTPLFPKKGRTPASSELLKDDSSGTVTEERDTDKLKDPNQALTGVFDGNDPSFNRFDIKDYEIKESAIIESQENIYIRFPMLTTQDDSLAKLLENKPIYELIPTETDENKKARLLFTLYSNKRYAVFLRTIDFYRQAFPESKYDEILRYMEADIYYELSKRDNSLSDFQVAMTKYKSLLLGYPNSPLAERTHLLIGYSYLERGDILGSLGELESFIRKYPQSPQRFQVTLAIADDYRKLNKYDEAEETLTKLEKDPDAGYYAAAAAYKKADNNIERKEYDKALNDYQVNKKKYPDQHDKYPSAVYNSAEAFFWKGEYKKSLDTYREFLQKYPASSHGGYAMNRIGELLEILGAEKQKVIGAYLETIFRYRGSQGAGIANIRLTRERFPEMKDKEIDTVMKEIHAFVNKSELPLIRDFEVITLSDGFFNRGEYDRALSQLVPFYQENPLSSNLEIIKGRIVKTLTQQMRSLVAKEDYLDAFRLYGKNLTTWLKNADRIDLSYYLGRSYEGAGVPAEAAKIYREALNKLYTIQGTIEEKERRVFEELPAREAINLRLAAMAERQNDLNQTGKYLADIKSTDLLTENERIEMVSLSAKVAKAKGDLLGAEKYILELITKWKGKPEILAPIYLELAQIESDLKKYGEAEIQLAKIVSMAQDTKLVPNDVHAKAAELKGDVLLTQGKKDEAILAYQDLLENFEPSMELGSIRYKVGKLLFEQGKLADAEKVWTPLSQKPANKLWSQMAKEQLTHAKWQDDYKKYIDRIPAMSPKEKK